MNQTYRHGRYTRFELIMLVNELRSVQQEWVLDTCLRQLCDVHLLVMTDCRSSYLRGLAYFISLMLVLPLGAKVIMAYVHSLACEALCPEMCHLGEVLQSHWLGQLW